MTQKSKLVIPDVVFNMLNAELSTLFTSFTISLNAGSALVENPSNLFVESCKTCPVLHVQDSPVSNSILVRLWVQIFIQKVKDMRRMQNGSKPSIQMVYEGCLRAEARPFSGWEISPRLIEDETFNDSDSINNLMDYAVPTYRTKTWFNLLNLIKFWALYTQNYNQSGENSMGLVFTMNDTIQNDLK
ncbi:uncharacterized protein TNCV_1073501 [Trichonephila clavipes]|nr:uncharacterized protein TNCV_1073501 [Trichonephila clavipes]